ncbi:cupin domain-containing protein [Haliovirga abyssi]|uniref:Oxalate-binding protein n=1 Tax=Haliovirga abyssi TaxID=2996794 RepID=A0AAU9E1L2_9FUSO|nr:cupin domain-containing protein [Haliovirga abyssi]BDU50265.1 oxalate-binding protein [Haliovirga abyssi]
MIIKIGDTKQQITEKPRGGVGEIIANMYLKDSELENSLTGFNMMQLKKNSEVGYHQHINDEEIYYILTGKGIVNDNGIEKEVEAGDMIYTKQGEFHSIKNIGDELLEFIAFIIKK